MSKPKQRARRLTPDEKRSILTLVCRGYGPTDVATELRDQIPHLKPHVVRDCAKRNPDLLAQIASERTLADAGRLILSEALQKSVREAVDATRQQLVTKLPEMIVREADELRADQDMLAGLRSEVKSPADASSYMRSRMLRQQRQDLVFGVAPPAAEQASQNTNLHLHLSSAWTPRRVAPADEKSDNPPDRAPDVRRPE